MCRYDINIFKDKYITLLVALCLFSVLGNAQTISVTNFYLMESDLTANSRNSEVLDQNGDKCALIKIQTTQKGFSFDVGSAGIQKVDDNHTGEIWVYVPYGVKHISIKHQLLGSMPNYDFPINIQKARTYVMEITSDKVFVNNYDDSRKQKLLIKVTPANSSFTLNGMKVQLNSKGEVEQELSFGTYTYKVESQGYYPKEGQITINDPDKKQNLTVSDMMPIKGKLSVHVNPYMAEVYVDGRSIGRSTALEPYELQIGKHEIKVSLNGYKTETKTVTIEEDKSTDIQVTLTQVATYKITSNPIGADITINKESIGSSPCSKELTSGTYVIKATKSGYKDYNKSVELKSSNPDVHISLSKIYNYKNEFYMEGNVRAGTFAAFGGTMGCYINNVNIEASYLSGTGNNENIYWSGNDVLPTECTYTPSMTISAKIGYGFALGTRFRLAPQIGMNVLTLKETIEDGFTVAPPADGANVISGLASLRFSAAIASSFAISLSPEYSFVMSESKGYTALSAVSPQIEKWGGGFNIKLGLTVFF